MKLKKLHILDREAPFSWNGTRVICGRTIPGDNWFFGTKFFDLPDPYNTHCKNCARVLASRRRKENHDSN